MLDFAGLRVDFVAAEVGEGEEPDGVVAIAAAEDGDDGVQPVGIVDVGGGCGQAEFYLAGRHLALADGGGEEVGAAAGQGEALFAAELVVEPAEALPAQGLDDAAEPEGLAAAGEVAAEPPAFQAVEVGFFVDVQQAGQEFV